MFGGAVETFTYELGRGLAKLDNEVFIITRNGINQNKKFETNLTIYSLKIPDNPFMRGAFYNFKAMKSLLKLKSVDLLHTQGTAVFPIAYFVAKRFGTPIVHTEHVYFPWVVTPFTTLKKRSRYPLELVLGKFVLKNATKIVVANEFMKKSMQFINPNISTKVEIIPQGINQNVFNLKVNRAYIRKKFNLSDRDKLILYVGRIIPEKNVLLLIKAFYELKREYDNIKLLLVGPKSSRFPTLDRSHESSKYYLRLETWIEQKKLRESVIFTGPIPYNKIPYYYAGCDLLVQPSPLETFGRSIFEAAAMGIPFICSRVGGITPTYLPKASSIFINMINSSKLQSAIKTILKNEVKFKNNGRDAAKLIHKRYNWIEIAKRYLKIYKTSIKN